MRRHLIAACALFALLPAAAEQRPGWLGFGFDYHRPAGAAAGWMYVRLVVANSPAAKAGLKPQDVITTLNGTPLHFAKDQELLATLGKVRSGDRLKLGIRRGAAAIDVILLAAPMSDEMYRLWQRNQAMAKKP